MPDITEEEKSILEYLRSRRLAQAVEIERDLKMGYEDTIESLRILQGFGLVDLDVVKTNTMDIYSARISNRGILYLKGRSYEETLAQVNSFVNTGTMINSPVVQRTQGNVGLEISRSLAPIAKEINLHTEMLEHERRYLLQILEEMKDPLAERDKAKFEVLESSALKVAPFLFPLFEQVLRTHFG